jgi:predicted secreted protein
MAIKNASDLLVYKKSPANVAQVTRIRVLSTTPLDPTGTFNLLNAVDSSGTDIPSTTIGQPNGNTGTFVLNKIYNELVTTNSDYTAVSKVTDGDYVYQDFTNVYAGDLDQIISISNGTGVFEDGAIQVTVITSGETLNNYEPIAYSTSASISFNNDLRDVTTKDSGGFQENIAGLKSFELSSDALQDVNADLEFKEFYDDINEGNEVIVRFAERATGGTDVKWEGNGYISSLSMDASVEENVTYSVAITGTSSVVKSTY